ncbi:unnamed protein product [Dibothriocephalus latus]|uniref:Uncharacterized protein n=1 Tax=Dibothriocephalus latus TaxID=60516 RepID=A0A3P7RA47_DIBLA|nr:unnamed protein product [Dibothriocephalus latus]
MENEHLNNCGHYRAVRDIFVMPMRRNTSGTVKKDTANNAAAVPLQNGFEKSQLYTHCEVVGHKPFPEHYRDPKRVNAPLQSILTTFPHFGQYITMASTDSQKPCRSLEDVWSNTRNEHWRKHDVVVSPRMQSAPCVMGAHCHMYNSAPNIPGSNPQTETSSLTDQTNHLRAGDNKEMAGGGDASAATDDVTSTGGNSSTQFDIMIPSTSSDSSADNARPSGRGRNLFLNYTLLVSVISSF